MCTANVNIVVFIPSPICTKSHPQGSTELIPSTANKRSFQVFDFLRNNGNPFLMITMMTSCY
ncbi:hypothetical protein V6N13_052967 [Hibiscus sabdariffa]